MLKTFVINVALAFFVVVIGSSCSTTTGTVSRGYNYTKDKIWYCMKDVVNKNYGGVKKIEPDPPSMVSNLFLKDQQFGIDKTAYQAVVGLSGFTRPYVVDVEVRVFPDGEEKDKYSTDRSKAQEIINQITAELNHRKYNTPMQEEFTPY